MNLEEKEISRKILYRGSIFAVEHACVLLPDGREAGRDIVHTADAVAVAALDENENLLLVQQYRIAYGQLMTELPAGKLNPGEEPRKGALRELMEETGCVPGKLTYLFGLKMTPGCVTETVHCFLAEELKFGQAQPDDGEFLRVMKMPLREALDAVLSGELRDAKTAATVLAVDRILKKER